MPNRTFFQAEKTLDDMYLSITLRNNGGEKDLQLYFFYGSPYDGDGITIPLSEWHRVRSEIDKLIVEFRDASGN